MNIKNKILFSSLIIWLLFLFILYVSAHHYLLLHLLLIGDHDNQTINMNHYVFNQVIHHYLMIVIFIGLLIGGFASYFLSVFLNKNEIELQRLHLAMANEVKAAAELHKKINILTKRAEKTDRIETILHPVCDLLNNVGTSLSVAKETMENSSAEKLTDLVALLAQHQDNIGAFMMNDTQGQEIPGYLAAIAKMWVDENNFLIKELAFLDNHFNQLSQIIKKI